MLQFKEKILRVFNSTQADLVIRAWDFAEKMHGDQKRDSGEPYFTHPVAVASILFDLGLDSSTLAAALLHDCVEDTNATESDIENLFGNEVAELVAGVTKLDKIAFKSKEEEQAENFRRMFFAMAKDIRVIIIKLADRLHNMRTISSISHERQMAMARETLEIFAPLASRLGLSYLKCELEDLCLKVLEPEIYDKLVGEIALKRKERQELVNRICVRLTSLLEELNVKGEVSGRPKHFYSIYKKMKNNNRTFDQIYDLTAVRVIVENVKRSGKVGYGFNALTEEYTDMIPSGIVDPTKVTRSALQNAASVASMVLTTESLVADIKEPPVAAPAAPDMGGMY